MKQKLMVLNVVLLLLGGLVGWRYRLIWQEARERENRVLKHLVEPEKASALPALSPYAPSVAASYSEVVQKMLFARDRNPNVIYDPPPPAAVEPMPALPAFYGLMTGFGDPGIILGINNVPQKIYRVGDKVGAFKLVAFDRATIKLEWKDETVERRLDELLAKNVAPAAAAPVAGGGAAPPPPPPPPSVAATPLGPGMDTGGGYRACQANDSTPTGTVVDGVRKVTRSTPFGQSCAWVPAK